jgi:hypothetical protein
VRPRFCPDCGQETDVRPPRIGEFIQQFGGAYFSTEGALWRTIALLLFKPGELTRQYLAGRRRHYVLPLRLYLTTSVTVLLLLRLVATADLGIERHDSAATPRPPQAQLSIGGGRAGVKDGVFSCHDLPDWLCQRLKSRIDVDAKAMTAQLERFKERFVGNLGAAMFVLLPIFAFWLKLAYFNRRMRYAEHLVFALHLHAFWFLLVALFTTGVDAIISVAMLALPLHAVLAARRVYGGRWSMTVLRGLAIALAYGLSLLLSLALFGLWAYLA